MKPATVGSPAASRPAFDRATMMRAVTAAMLGAGVAAAAVYAYTGGTPHQLAAWLGGSERAALPEAWPICTTMGSLADSADWAELDADFAAGKKALADGDWQAAIAAFKLAALREPRGADIQNYIGYAYRRLRQIEPAFAHYRRALELNPRHRGALQHLGEAYAATGNLAKAEEQLATFERICLLPCDEHADLERVIATYRTAASTR
jgi:tetratricopeptide (TPR) repeat protein